MVEWALESEGAGTRLRLIHSTLPSKMGRGYAAGWHAYLERLDAIRRDTQAPDFDERFAALLEVYAS